MSKNHFDVSGYSESTGRDNRLNTKMTIEREIVLSPAWVFTSCSYSCTVAMFEKTDCGQELSSSFTSEHEKWQGYCIIGDLLCPKKKHRNMHIPLWVLDQGGNQNSLVYGLFLKFYHVQKWSELVHNIWPWPSVSSYLALILQILQPDSFSQQQKSNNKIISCESFGLDLK